MNRKSAVPAVICPAPHVRMWQTAPYLLIILAVLWITAGSGRAAQITLAWDAAQPTPEGYRLFQRTPNTPYDYSRPVWTGSASTCTVSGLSDGTRYHFVVRAYQDDLESSDSNEVTYEPALADSETDAPDGLPTAPAAPPADSGTDAPAVPPAAPDMPVAPDTAVNQPPVAEAGPNQTAVSGRPVRLNGSNSSDPEGRLIGCRWVQTAGPAVALSVADALQPTFDAPHVAAGESVLLMFELTVWDDALLAGSDTCLVHVAAQDNAGGADGLLYNQAPMQPLLVYPADGEGAVPLRPLMRASDFSDPDDGDTLAGAEWVVSAQEDGRTVVNVVRSGKSPTRLRIPRLALDADTAYVCRVRYFDDHGNASDWSPAITFTTREAFFFWKDNGAAQDPTPVASDLNDNGLSDADESDTIKSTRTPDGRKLVAVSIEESVNIIGLDEVILTEPAPEDELPVNMDFGMDGILSYRIQVREPGQEAAVTFHFSEGMDSRTVWMALDENGSWSDCAAYMEQDGDGRTVYRQVADGGPEDADGVANGTIIDQVIARDAASYDDAAYVAANADPAGASGGGGCFIHSLLCSNSN